MTSFDLNQNTTVADLLLVAAADPKNKDNTTTTDGENNKKNDFVVVAKEEEEEKKEEEAFGGGGPTMMIENWAQSYSVDSSKFRFPKTLEELQTIVAYEKNIRCVGSMHSCAPLIESSGVVVSLEHFNQVLDVDVDKKIVTLQGGAKIHDVVELLKPYKLAVGTLGTIDWQAMAGAVMTGTHGGSLQIPSLHDFVESYTILKADGDIVKVSKSQDPHLFSAMAPSLGCFGIVVEMEMRCVPFQYLEAKMISVPFQQLLGPTAFMDIMKSNHYCRIIIYPSLGERGIATIWTAHEVEKDEAIAKGAHYTGNYINFRNAEEKQWLEEWLECNSKGTQSGYAEADEKLQQVLDSQLNRLSHYVGDYNHVLCKERNNGIPHADMEFGFPFEKAPQVLQAIYHYCETNRMPYYNFEMRTTKADDAMLSCCHKRDTLWIDFQCKAEHMSEFFGSIEDLLAPIGYRKHWAKGMDHTSPEYLMTQFPMLPDFLAYIEQFDPEGKFRNEHVDMWFEQTKSVIDSSAISVEKPWKATSSMDETEKTHSMDETWKTQTSMDESSPFQDSISSLGGFVPTMHSTIRPAA